MELHPSKMDEPAAYARIEGALEAFISNVDQALKVRSNVRYSDMPISIKTGPDYFISLGTEIII